MENMTIAQALRKVKQLKGLIAESEQRAKAGVSYNTEKMPAFSYADSVKDMISYQDEMIVLEAKIAVANATNFLTFGDKKISLALAIRTMQEVKGRISFYRSLTLRNEVVKDRSQEWDDVEMKHINRVVETTYRSDLSEKERDAEVKLLQSKFDTINNMVENANHTIFI